MANELHVIFGTGPMGCWIAQALCARGLSVRAVNRSGTRPDLLPAAVEVVRSDAASIEQATSAARSASVVYQALGPAYHLWQELFPRLQQNVMAAARVSHARYVSIENLYMYDSSSTIVETSQLNPVSKKGELRLKMAEEVMAAHRRGDLRTTALRSSDYYGPGVVQSALGEMVFGNLVAGKKAQVIGSASMPHSFAYIEDAGVAAAALGASDRSWGEVWIAPHAPARTQGVMIEDACRVLGTEAEIKVLSPFMMRLGGLFIPAARASVEMMYEFTAPFVVDSSRIEREFGMSATSVSEAIERTVAWYQGRRTGNQN
jgi:nucleoside-diphosphate-sugar epimerase